MNVFKQMFACLALFSCAIANDEVEQGYFLLTQDNNRLVIIDHPDFPDVINLSQACERGKNLVEYYIKNYTNLFKDIDNNERQHLMGLRWPEIEFASEFDRLCYNSWLEKAVKNILSGVRVISVYNKLLIPQEIQGQYYKNPNSYWGQLDEIDFDKFFAQATKAKEKLEKYFGSHKKINRKSVDSCSATNHCFASEFININLSFLREHCKRQFTKENSLGKIAWSIDPFFLDTFKENNLELYHLTIFIKPFLEKNISIRPNEARYKSNPKLFWVEEILNWKEIKQLIDIYDKKLSKTNIDCLAQKLSSHEEENQLSKIILDYFNKMYNRENTLFMLLSNLINTDDPRKPEISIDWVSQKFSSHEEKNQMSKIILDYFNRMYTQDLSLAELMYQLETVIKSMRMSEAHIKPFVDKVLKHSECSGKVISQITDMVKHYYNNFCYSLDLYKMSIEKGHQPSCCEKVQASMLYLFASDDTKKALSLLEEGLEGRKSNTNDDQFYEVLAAAINYHLGNEEQAEYWLMRFEDMWSFEVLSDNFGKIRKYVKCLNDNEFLAEIDVIKQKTKTESWYENIILKCYQISLALSGEKYDHKKMFGNLTKVFPGS